LTDNEALLPEAAAPALKADLNSYVDLRTRNRKFRTPERQNMTTPAATVVSRGGALNVIWSGCGKTIIATLRDVKCLWLILKHTDTPWHVRGLLFLPVAYVCSPIQLFPNFIPIFGQLDDLFVIWIANKLVLRFVSEKIRRECREAVA
jgi:uncharacterized membrane protein YkvA (DUF1232 family)